jgi:hypothetical protein
MPSLWRLWQLCLVSVVLATGLPCSAKSVVRVLSSISRMEIAADGSARIQQELRVESSSGALHSLAVQGLDEDAAPLPDARITRSDAPPGQNSAPEPLELRIAAGRAELWLAHPKGIAGKSFSIEFGYQTQLLRRGLIRSLPRAQRAELAWTGPSFDDGLDSVTLVVRTDSAATAPEALDPNAELTGAPAAPDGARATPGNYGIVTSTLRRSTEQDELELVRAHVARHEAPRWRVLLDDGLFDSAPPSAAATAPEAEPSEADLDGIWPAPENGPPRPPTARALGWIVAAAIGYGLLVAAKARSVTRASALCSCQVRALVAGRATLHAALAGLLLALAASAVIWLDAPLAGALALLVALAFAAHRAPASEARLRGPGQWQPLDSSALEPLTSAGPALPGAWLDVGRAQGFALLCALLAALTGLALRVFESSPYYGACLLLGSTALLPVFCTGRAAELPEPALAQSRRFLARVAKSLSGKAELLVQPLGRFCTGASELDELRLAIHPARGLQGLIGMELALELRPGLAGPSPGPVLVIRASDGSECQRALPRQLSWSRGRSAEERAALVRPKLPTVALSVALVLELCAAASEPLTTKAAQLSASAPPRRRLRASPAVP